METLSRNQTKEEEIIQRINQLSNEKTTKFHAIRFFKSHQVKAEETLSENEKKLEEIDTQLMDLFLELRTVKPLYFIEYVLEHTIYNSTKYWETKREYLRFDTDCQINTIDNGWEKYTNDSSIEKLLNEINQYILHEKFSNFKIKQIRRE
ncbi:MAG: hypothetical protein M9916_11940 [Crocinitomicaceae bacterium]|nr:hypothetical protein [Crocinitomicaceae bacterium]